MRIAATVVHAFFEQAVKCILDQKCHHSFFTLVVHTKQMQVHLLLVSETLLY